MSMINKVPAWAGAQWLLGSFALLRRSPLALASVSMSGFFMVMLSVLLGMLILAGTAQVPFPLSLVPDAAYSVLTAGVSSFVFAGILFAMREVAQGRPAVPKHLLHGFEHPRALLVTALAPMAAGMVMSLLLVALIGDDAQKFAEVFTQLKQLQDAGGQPDPVKLQALLAQLPLFNIFLWLFLAMAILALTYCVVMLAVPQIVFANEHGFAALRASVAANVRNLPAMLVFVVLLAICLFVISSVAQILMLVLQTLLGPTFAVIVVSLLQLVVILPLLAGCAYHAYHEIFESQLPVGTDAPLPGTLAA